MEETLTNQSIATRDWKQMFQREIKVNKELGRRLRVRHTLLFIVRKEIKDQLEREKLQTRELTTQLLERKRHQHCEEEPNQKDECCNCKRLEIEVARLRRFVADAYPTPSQKSIASTLTVEDFGRGKDAIAPESHLSTYEEADATTIGTNLLLTHEVPSRSSQPVSATSGLAAEGFETKRSNQTDHNCHVFADTDSSSLGALFKYAVVLAGPMRAKPRKKQGLLFSDCFNSLDFQRTRNPQECMEQTDHDENAGRPRSAPAGKWKGNSPSGGSVWSLKRQSQALLDNVNEDRVSTPLRRAATGLLSNLVPNGLRGGASSSAPSTPPLPPVAPVKATPPSSVSASPTSKLLCVYPPNSGEVQELEGLLEICFPYGDDPPLASDFSLAHLKRSLQERHRTFRSPDSTFVLTIASASNPTEITYAICVRCPLFPDRDDDGNDESANSESSTLADGPTQCCLCLLSPYPFFGLFFKVLYGIAVLWNMKRREACKAKNDKPIPTSDDLATMLEKPLGMLDFVEEFQGVMERLKEMPIPSMGGWSRMLLSPKITHLAFHRPHSASLAVERRHLLLEYAAPTLFGLLSVDQVLFLLGCLCSERKVLVVSDHVNIVSSCVLALITLLHPLQWAGPVITVLPPRLNELLEAPVPLIAGRVSINSASIKNFSTLDRPIQDVIEMNMDQNLLHMHEEDLVTYHELKLPECDELVHELEPFSTLLFGKHEAPDFPTVQQDEACKIMCSRIHHHIESICALAMVEKKERGSPVEVVTPDEQSHQVAPGDLTTRTGAPRRCSAMTADYITRFQETQMFSMFTMQAQDVQNESDEGDVERDDSENDGFVEEEYHYEMEDALYDSNPAEMES